MSIVGSEQWMYASGEEVTQQSLKFNDDESQYLSWTPASAGNRQTWTWSAWLKRSGLSTIQQLFCSTAGDYNLRFHTDNTIIFEGAFGTNTSAAVFRDVSAFYHIVAVHDTTESTSSDRFKLYVNGVQQTTSGAYPSGDGIINNTVEHGIGGQSGINFFDGYLSNIHFIDGQALDATSFGQFTNGYWEKIDYAGSYGTNGFHLTFADDVVSEGFNAVTYRGTGANQSISGLGLSPDLVLIKNRTYNGSGYGWFDSVRGATIRLDTTITSGDNTNSTYLQSFDNDGFTVGNSVPFNNPNDSIVAWAWDAGDVTSLVTNGDFSNGTTGWTANNCSASVNSDGRLAATYSSSGAYVYQLLTTVVGKTYAITYNNYQAADFVFVHATSPTGTQIASSNSSGTAPILFTATTTTTSIRFDIPNSQTRIIDDVQVFEANTDGTITSTVKANPAYGFSIATYTGTGGTKTVGTGLGAIPAMVIVKSRSASAFWKVWHKDLTSGNNVILNDTSAQASYNNRVGTNHTASVVEVIDGTSSVDNVNDNGGTYVMYSFAEVAGYSSIGSYTGTGADHSSEQTLGFRPAFVLVKDSTAGGDPWVIFDNTRDTDGTLNNLLFPNSGGAEVSSSVTKLEISDTGFTVKGTGTAHNNNGSTIIYMAFADTREAAFWKDVSGQGNHWTPNNLDYRDSLPDSPANNFAVLNPLDINSSGGMTLSEGNLKLTSTNAGSAFCSFSNIALENGSWYSEVYINGQTGGYPNVGIGDLSKSPTANEGIFAVKGVGYAADGNVYRDGGTIIDTVSSFTTGDVIGIAYDADNQKIYFSKNGTWQNSADPAAGTNGYTVNAPIEGYVFGASIYSPAPMTFSFGQDSTFAGAKPMGAYTDDNSIGNFQYAPPAGYLALCSANLPTPTIIDGSEHFNTVLWSAQSPYGDISISGVNFQADFVWVKSRPQAYNHTLFDSVRGVAKTLYSDSTSAETANSPYGYLSSFDADGFTGSAGSTDNSFFNYTGNSYVAWNWKAGGAAVSNTAGTITSQVSANTAAGFSIASYSGTGSAASFGHGLATEPSMVIVKGRNVAVDWVVYHKDLGKDKFLYLNEANAVGTISNYWGAGGVTNSVVGLNTYSGNNGSYDYIAYCFADVEGYSKAGSFVGNGSTDGPFVYTGFRPAFILAKANVNGSYWVMHDSERDTYNVSDKYVWANLSNAEGSIYSKFDFLSNGFKCRNANDNINYSGSTVYYIAFAEHPFKYSNAR